jgi:hypothetical protein
MTKSKGIRTTPHRRWSEADEAWLRQVYPKTSATTIAAILERPVSQVHAKARRLKLSKAPGFVAEQARRDLLGRGDHPFHRHRFSKGSVPPNKGVKGWVAGGRSAETQIKPGTMPHNWVPVGSYRLNNADQALERKVTDLPGPPNVRWKPVSRLVWEAANGPVPEGHMVVFKPGRRTTVLEEITPDALECITKAENARRNSIQNLPPELADLARLRGQLVRAINRKAKENPQP